MGCPPPSGTSPNASRSTAPLSSDKKRDNASDCPTSAAVAPTSSNTPSASGLDATSISVPPAHANNADTSPVATLCCHAGPNDCTSPYSPNVPAFKSAVDGIGLSGAIGLRFRQPRRIVRPQFRLPGRRPGGRSTVENRRRRHQRSVVNEITDLQHPLRNAGHAVHRRLDEGRDHLLRKPPGAR